MNFLVLSNCQLEQYLYHSMIHSLNHLFIQSFMQSSIHSFVFSFLLSSVFFLIIFFLSFCSFMLCTLYMATFPCSKTMAAMVEVNQPQWLLASGCPSSHKCGWQI